MWKIEHYFKGVYRVSDIVSWHLQLIPIQSKVAITLAPGTGASGVGAVLVVVVAIYDAAANRYDPVALEINETTKLIKVE